MSRLAAEETRGLIAMAHDVIRMHLTAAERGLLLRYGDGELDVL